MSGIIVPTIDDYAGLNDDYSLKWTGLVDKLGAPIMEVTQGLDKLLAPVRERSDGFIAAPFLDFNFYGKDDEVQASVKKRKRKKWLLAALTAAASLIPGVVKACIGPRQIGGGGAAVTEANNSEATYWMPGLLPFLEGHELSYTHSFGDVDRFRYDNVLAMAMPFGRFGIGMNFSNSRIRTDNYDEDFDFLELAFGAGFGLSDNWDLGIGSSVMYGHVMVREPGKNQTITSNWRESPMASEENYKRWDVNAGLFLRGKNVFLEDDCLRFGLLAQFMAVNQDFDFNNTSYYNVRPGMGFSLPNRLGMFSAAMSYYNFDELFNGDRFGGDKESGPRFGLTQTLGRYSFRAGLSRDNGENEFTFGFGTKIKNLGIDIAYTTEDYGLIGVSYQFE